MGFFTKYLNKYIEQKFVDCPIELDKERCASLGQICENICAHNCPNQAIALDTKSIDEISCKGCGNCVTSCPNGAFSFTNLKDDTLLRNIIHHGKDKTTVRFCCNSSDIYHQKNKDKQNNDIDIEQLTSITVDCMSRLHPGLLLAPLAVNAQYVWLDTIGCLHCPKNHNSKVLENIDINFTEAVEWLAQLEVEESRLMLASKMPEPVKVVTKKQIVTSSQFNRRAFFVNIGNEVKSNTVGVAGDVADHILSDEQKKLRMQIAPNQRKNGPSAHRHILLQVLKKLKAKRSIEKELYYYQQMKIDDMCNLCNICSRLCPTGAIELEKDGQSQRGTIHYRPGYCINCRKCESVCPRKLISFIDNVSVQDFVDQTKLLVLERELIKCRKCKDHFPSDLAKNGLCQFCYR